MSRTVYLNGEFVPADQARVSIFDRGLLFGDGIYEVAGVIDGKLVNFEAHLARMHRSLGELSIPAPLQRAEILDAYRKLVSDNSIKNGLVYMQITRGVQEREFTYPEDLTPTVFMFAQEKPPLDETMAANGVTLKSVPDLRWARRDIKSTNLLAQVMAKQQAKQAGAYEALMIDPDGNITECGATSFYIIRDQTIITRPLSHSILPGVTRSAIVELSWEHDLEIVQRLFDLDQVFAADEAFITGASTTVLSVCRVDDQPIGNGKPGAMATALREIYLKHIRNTAI